MGKYLKYNFSPTVVLPLSSFFVAVSFFMCIFFMIIIREFTCISINHYRAYINNKYVGSMKFSYERKSSTLPPVK